ncbi:hypothetical protein KKC45_02740, partial [Patescibacteria group bacterium]|nr:hypothetical protein [Patescibacteria group bacterium]
GRTKTPKEFYNILARTKVGVSVSGGGYDTARFWEILGNNCILLTEKIDIFKKEDKKFGYKTIYEFKDLKDFKIQLEKIGEYLKNNYDDKKNLTEFQEIIRNHSSSARVEFILEEARKNGLID